MDFNALLAAHGGNEGGSAAANSVIGALDAPLSTPRGGGGGGGDSYREQRLARIARGEGSQGRDHGSRGRGRRGRNNNREDDWKPETQEVEPGAFLYQRVWGDYPKWDEEWSSEDVGDVVVQFEARGEDNIVVALSPEPRLITPMYEIVIGGWKDTKSVIRREPQGVERALAAKPNLCTRESYSKYWVMLRKGVISMGLGEKPGRQVVMAWKDPDPLPARYASFTTWDRNVTFRNIHVAPAETDMELDEIEMSSYVPAYLAKLEEERAALRAQAEREGQDYVEPDAAALAEKVLDPVEREMLKHRDPIKVQDKGFVTGFDPQSEEERKKAEERAKRFGIEPKAGETNEDEDAMFSREKRETRAKRFGVPLIEDTRLGKGLIRDLTGLRVPRKDPAAEDMMRSEVLHIYGSFDQLYTRDLLEWFGVYGASSIEWLHDCAANIAFADIDTAKRALTGLCVSIPPIEGFDAEVEQIKGLGYQCAPFPFPDGTHRYFLVRLARVSDVKAVEPEYRTKIGFNPNRDNKRRSNYKVKRARNQIISKAQAAAMESITGKTRKRDDSDDEQEGGLTMATGEDNGDGDGEDEGVAKRRRMQVDDE